MSQIELPDSSQAAYDYWDIIASSSECRTPCRRWYAGIMCLKNGHEWIDSRHVALMASERSVYCLLQCVPFLVSATRPTEPGTTGGYRLHSSAESARRFHAYGSGGLCDAGGGAGVGILQARFQRLRRQVLFLSLGGKQLDLLARDYRGAISLRNERDRVGHGIQRQLGFHSCLRRSKLAGERISQYRHAFSASHRRDPSHSKPQLDRKHQ